jgi:hypothetical protein
MALSLDIAFTSNDIDHITMFKDLKVWRLQGNNNDSIVIKTDAVHQPQLKSASPIIKAISTASKLKILSAGEILALKSFVSTFEDIDRAYRDLGMAYRPNEAGAVADLKQSLTFGFPFVKMAYVQQTNLESALESRLGGDKTDLQEFTATLNAPGGFERLGKIIAADLFNGNTDRFFPGSASTKTIGGVTFDLRCLVNVGNVFRVRLGAGSEVGALDFVDPNSNFKNINTPLAQIEGPGLQWPARILLDRTLRKDFAKDIVHDFELILSPHKSKYSLKTKLKMDAASRLVDGMVQGAQLITAKLQLKYNPNGWTPGITDRYNIICQVA